MARGNKKSQALSVKTAEEKSVDLTKPLTTAVSRDPVIPRTPAIDRAAEYLTAHPEHFEAFRDLVVKAANHLGGSSKSLRTQIVKYFNRLPDEVKAAITEPKEFISKLYRGSSHPNNPGPDGNVNAGFSIYMGTARTWTYNGTNKYGKKEEGIYTGDQIESFDAIINMNKVGGLLARYNELADTNPAIRKIPKASHDESDEPHAFYAPGGGTIKTNPEHFSYWSAAEGEHLVTGIVWKKDAGVEARRNRLRFDKKYPNWGEETMELGMKHDKKWMPY